MILKCEDGPMAGAIYHLDNQQPQTNRKPDGLLFARQQENGVWVDDLYRFDRLSAGVGHVTMVYRFVWSIDSIPLLVARPSVPDEVAENVRLTPREKNQQ